MKTKLGLSRGLQKNFNKWPTYCCPLKRLYPTCCWYMTTWNRYVNTELKVVFPDICSQIYWQYYSQHLCRYFVFGGPSLDLVLFSSLYRVLIERETLLTTFQIGLQLSVFPSMIEYNIRQKYIFRWFDYFEIHWFTPI